MTDMVLVYVIACFSVVFGITSYHECYLSQIPLKSMLFYVNLIVFFKTEVDGQSQDVTGSFKYTTVSSYFMESLALMCTLRLDSSAYYTQASCKQFEGVLHCEGGCFHDEMHSFK